jgi:hypothetical protein
MRRPTVRTPKKPEPGASVPDKVLLPKGGVAHARRETMRQMGNAVAVQDSRSQHIEKLHVGRCRGGYVGVCHLTDRCTPTVAPDPAAPDMVDISEMSMGGPDTRKIHRCGAVGSIHDIANKAAGPDGERVLIVSVR